MANKEIWLPFKIYNFVNLRRNGKWVCHVLIDEDDLAEWKKGTMYESTDDIADEDLKAMAESHVFLGQCDAADDILDDDEILDDEK